jgi:tetratricopeptide (TPR) repeat protein
MAEPGSPSIIMDEKVEDFKGIPKVQTEAGGYASSTIPSGMAFSVPGEKDVFFDLGAELEDGKNIGYERFEEITTEKSYGFEEILKELKRTSGPSKVDPNFNYNMGVACREMGFVDEAIEQFQSAFEAGQKPFEAAYLLGLCFQDRGQPIEARQSFEKALKVEGASTDKLRELELTLIGMDQKREQRIVEFLKGTKVGGPQPKASFSSQNKKMAFAKLGSSLIFTHPPSIIRQTNP